MCIPKGVIANQDDSGGGGGHIAIMSHIAGDPRNVPRRQREPDRDRTDNYIDNTRRLGNPNLTDETDIFDVLYEEDKIRNEELRKQQSIQRWSNR